MKVLLLIINIYFSAHYLKETVYLEDKLLHRMNSTEFKHSSVLRLKSVELCRI